MNLFEQLSVTTEKNSERPAILFHNTRLTYAQFHSAVLGFAGGLQRLGFVTGDRLALLMPNMPQFPIAYYGCAAIGVIAVPANPLLKPDELGYIWNDAGVKGVVTFPDAIPPILNARNAVPSLQTIISTGAEQPGVLSFDTLTRSDIPNLPVFDPATHPAVFLYTSGTTGRPKGCMLSHRNLVSNSQQSESAFAINNQDIMLAVLPLFHAFAATACMHLVIRAGAAMSILERFTPGGVLETIEQHRVTILPAVPSMFTALLYMADRYQHDLSSLRVCISGGAPMPVAVMKAFEERFGVPVLEGDGPTECSPVTSVNPLFGIRKPGSIGPALPGVEMRIVDDQDSEVPLGEVGEIVVRGDNVMLGYYNQPEATAEAMRGGWYHTGDMGRVDEDGYFYIVDRKKDMLLVGGLNVYPREVEEVLLHHPAIMECAVIGEYDALRGEVPVAYVVLKPEAEASSREIIRYCREQLAAYKVPKRVEFRESLPKSAAGKILKRLLRKERDQET